MASESMQAILSDYKSQGAKKKNLGSVEAQREGFDRHMAHLQLSRGIVTEDFFLAGRPARRFQPNRLETEEVVLYLHGGGYRTGSLDSHSSVMGHLAANCNAGVIGLDYRLAPENPFPAALDDSVAAFVEICTSFDAHKTMIAGDSAGGGLALACALRLKEENMPLTGCLALLSPATDLTMSGDSYGEFRELWADDCLLYSGDYPLDTVGISPLFGDMTGLPPILIHVANDEPLLDDSIGLERRATDMGVTVELKLFHDAFHCFQIFTDLPEAQDALADIGRFFKLNIRGMVGD